MKKILFVLSLICFFLSWYVLSYSITLPLESTTLSFFIVFLLSFAAYYKLSPTKNNPLEYITTNKEKDRVRLSLIIMINLILISIICEPYILQKYKVHTPPFYNLNNNIGWVAVIVFTFAFLILPIYKLLKANAFKKIIIYIAKWLRKWHIPLSLLGIVFVFAHVYNALISGLKFNYTYISGYLALLDLFVLSMLGLLRFKKLDKSLHKNLSYVFIVFTFLHYLFSELRM